MKKVVTSKFFLVLARTIDHRVGLDDNERPDIPILPLNYALFSFFLRFLIVMINFITCTFVIFSIIHHW